MKKRTIFAALLAGLLILGGCAQNISESGKLVVVGDSEYGWGDIDIEGGDAVYDFTLKNEGDSVLQLSGAQTSCMCTNVEFIFDDGSSSPEFGMHGQAMWTEQVDPGETFTAHVVFDPMAHGPSATGPITRIISIFSSSTGEDVELTLTGNVLSSEDYAEKYNDRDESDEASNETAAFQNISADELASMMDDKDFFLVDVHIPEQEHIEGTDAFISYLEVAESADELPEDKDTPIVVYCRSGSMSLSASQDLVDLGYSNVSNLEGGIQAYNAL